MERVGIRNQVFPGVAVLVVALFVAAALAGPGRLGTGPAAAVTPPSATFASSASSFGSAGVHPIRHVVVIVLENHNIGQVYDPAQGASYLRYLSATYGNATSFYAACHPSAPNYLAMTNGRTLQCGSDAYHVYNYTNLGDIVKAKGLTWKSYFESMPGQCRTTNSGLYVVRHDPFVYYSDIVHNATACDNHVVNSRSFNASMARGVLPNVSFYVPNLIDDCHNAPLANCSAWLKAFLTPILNSTKHAVQVGVRHTAFFVVFDEGTRRNLGGYNGTYGGHVWFAAISPYSVGLHFTNNSSTVSLLSTIEWLFHLGTCGGADGTSAFPAVSGLFSFKSNGY